MTAPTPIHPPKFNAGSESKGTINHAQSLKRTKPSVMDNKGVSATDIATMLNLFIFLLGLGLLNWERLYPQICPSRFLRGTYTSFGKASPSYRRTGT